MEQADYDFIKVLKRNRKNWTFIGKIYGVGKHIVQRRWSMWPKVPKTQDPRYVEVEALSKEFIATYLENLQASEGPLR